MKKILLFASVLALSLQALFSFQTDIKNCQISCCVNNEDIQQITQSKSCCQQTSQKQNFSKKDHSCSCSLSDSEDSSENFFVERKNNHCFIRFVENHLPLLNTIKEINESQSYSHNNYSQIWSNLLKDTIILRP